jgi:sodium-dependent dicarboxylate transporter 2/3/5
MCKYINIKIYKNILGGTAANRSDLIKDVMRKQLTNLGKTSIHEWSVFVCFIILILLWFFREPMFILGWGDFLKRKTRF